MFQMQKSDYRFEFVSEYYALHRVEGILSTRFEN